MTHNGLYKLFVVTAPGLDLFVHQELQSIGITNLSSTGEREPDDPSEEAGGVEFEGKLTDLYKANLYLRTANRILLRMGEFETTTFSELRKKAAQLPWEGFLRPGKPVSLRVACHKSRLYHSAAVAERIAGSIADRLGEPVNLEKFDPAANPLPQLVTVRLDHDRCTISIDSSGALLHRRGYRLETAKAPLRETLAAGVLLASGWDRQSPLIDPFCGSGTIVIEAALMARGIATGKNRSFAFMDWPNYNSKLWESHLNQAMTHEQTSSALIFASDRDAGAIHSAQANADRAGVLDGIQFSCQAFSNINPPEQRGWIVTNPPYGIRISAMHDLRNLYAQLGHVLQKGCRGWNANILCSNSYLMGHTGLKLKPNLTLDNGGIQVQMYSGVISVTNG